MVPVVFSGPMPDGVSPPDASVVGDSGGLGTDTRVVGGSGDLGTGAGAPAMWYTTSDQNSGPS